jgi:DNA adenine methylase
MRTSALEMLLSVVGIVFDIARSPIVKRNNLTLKSGTPLLSPLRYPGSKRRLAQYLQDVIQLNELTPELYVEPFAGGASVALQLACNGIVEKIGLSDLDPLIASFWQCVFFDTDWLVEAIEEVEVTLENWEIHKASNPDDDRGRALKCIFLNRTSFSGILSPGAGTIGGKSQRSAYDIGCRFTKATVVKRIRQASMLRDKVAFVWNLSWESCLAAMTDYTKDLDTDQVFSYLDPPFYFKAERLYTYYFTDQDHRALYDALTKLSTPWLLSYDPAKPIEELYSSNGMKPRRIELLYSVAGSSGVTPAKELIVTNLPKLPGQSRTWQTRTKRKATDKL